MSNTLTTYDWGVLTLNHFSFFFLTTANCRNKGGFVAKFCWQYLVLKVKKKNFFFFEHLCGLLAMLIHKSNLHFQKQHVNSLYRIYHQYFTSIPLESIRKPIVFWYFQEGQKWDIGLKNGLITYQLFCISHSKAENLMRSVHHKLKLFGGGQGSSSSLCSNIKRI